MYSTAEVPGHWHDGSLETFVNGLPMTPLFVTFMTTLPTFSTEPAPKMSGIASGVAPRCDAFAATRAWTSCSYSISPWYSGSSGRKRARAGDAQQAIASPRPIHHAAARDAAPALTVPPRVPRSGPLARVTLSIPGRGHTKLR